MIKGLIRSLMNIGVVIFLFACGQEEKTVAKQQVSVAVKTIIATAQPLSAQEAYSGTILPIERVRLSTRISGWIERIHFDEGESVRQGAVLVKLRSQDLEAKQAQAQAAIKEAEGHFNNVQADFKRIESLFEKQAATQKELDDIQAAFISAQSRMAAATEMKNEVDETLKYTSLSAPFNGVVARKMLQEGDLANPGQPIVEVENTSKVKIIAKAPENKIQSLSLGMPVLVSVAAAKPGFGAQNQQAVIDKIAPAADPISRQFEIHVVLDNQDGQYKSGMFARVNTLDAEGMSLLIPQSAVFRRGQLQGLFIIDSERVARLRWVQIGRKQDNLVEVLSGLNPGEQVVIEHGSQLLDGQKVEVK